MRRRTLVAVTAAAAFWIAPAAYAHDFNPPNGGRGDTPFNSGNPNAGKNFGIALENGQAENALLRNPTCGAHSIHPPGNP
jgi:hypothetical protein